MAKPGANRSPPLPLRAAQGSSREDLGAQGLGDVRHRPALPQGQGFLWEPGARAGSWVPL